MLKRFIKTLTPELLEIHLQALDHYVNGEPEIRLLKRICPRDRLAVDAGANIGTYTYFLQRYMSPVVAYEPNPTLAQRLKRLFPNVCVRNLALSNISGTTTLSIPVVGDRERHELGSISQQFLGESSTNRLLVNAITLDSERLDDVGFVKIDVEQHEREVLQGALDTISRCRPVIMTETTPLRYESDLPSEFEFLTSLGYEGWFSFEGVHYPFSEFRASTHANPREFGRTFMSPNVFFFPKENALDFSSER